MCSSRYPSLGRGQAREDAAAELFMEIPFEEQQALFRKLPLDFAAALIPAFPYYHAYLLLHARPLEEMTAIVERMNPGERMQFYEQLPEETWQTLMDELAAKPATSGTHLPGGVPPARPVGQHRQRGQRGRGRRPGHDVRVRLHRERGL